MYRSTLHQLAQRRRNMAPPSPHAIAVDAKEIFRGILGYFTFEQPDQIESILEDIGQPVPWLSTISSLVWSNLLPSVKEVWTDLRNILWDV